MKAPIATVPTAVITPGQTPAADVPNYLVPSILVTVLCCLFTGIPAIIYAAQVNNKLAAGDIAGARVASKNAKMWCWISGIVGLLTVGFYMFVVILGVAGRLRR